MTTRRQQLEHRRRPLGHQLLGPPHGGLEGARPLRQVQRQRRARRRRPHPVDRARRPSTPPASTPATAAARRAPALARLLRRREASRSSGSAASASRSSATIATASIGELTIRDVTREVSLDVEYGGRAKDPWGNERDRVHREGARSTARTSASAGTRCSRPAACWSAIASTSSSKCKPLRRPPRRPPDEKLNRKEGRDIMLASKVRDIGARARPPHARPQTRTDRPPGQPFGPRRGDEAFCS